MLAYYEEILKGKKMSPYFRAWFLQVTLRDWCSATSVVV